MSTNSGRGLLVIGGTALFGVVLGGGGLATALHLGWMGNKETVFTADSTHASSTATDTSMTAGSTAPTSPSSADKNTQSDPAVVNPADTSVQDEEEFALTLIEELAAHPEDPQKSADVAGTTDEELAEFTYEDIVDLFERTLPYAEENEDQPQYLFALGRTAWVHGDDELAEELLLKAADQGSAAAHAYLARISDDLDESESYLEQAIAGGFEPANQWLEEVQQAQEEAQQQIATTQQNNVANQPNTQASSAEPDFSSFAFPELMQAFYEGRSAGYANQPLLPLTYVSGLNDALSDQSMLYLVQDPRNFLREIDPNLGLVAGKRLMTSQAGVNQTTQTGMKALMGMFTAMADVRRRGGTIQEEIAATNQALLGGGSSGSGGASYMSVKEAKDYGMRDGRMLAFLFDENPEAFRRIYQGMQRFVHQEVR